MTDQSPSEFINSTSRMFSLYTVESRAIPRLTDGLKKSQRIALWLMKDKPKSIKTAALVGTMLAKLYDHGDQSAGQTVGYLAAPYLNNTPLLVGEGQFGSKAMPGDKAIGAPRYTEVRRSKFAQDNLFVDMDICEHVENYDGTVTMADTFLPLIPLVLLNGVHGMAVAHACKFLPRTYQQLVQATLDVLEYGEVKTSLTPTWVNYDCDVFPGPRAKNSYFIWGKIERTGKHRVRITELPPPPGMTPAAYITGVLEVLEEKGTITRFTDASTDEISIDVQFPTGALEGKTDSQIMSMLKMITPITENLTVISPDGSTVKKYDSPEALIVDFVEWRKTYYIKRYENLIAQTEARIVYLRTFLSMFSGRSPIVSKIHKYTDRQVLYAEIEGCAQKAGIATDPTHLSKLCDLSAHRFTETSKEKAENELANLLEDLIRYQEILDSPNKRDAIYMDEVRKILDIEY